VQWRRFENFVKRAITSCKQSGNEPLHHFAGAGKPIEGGKGAVQFVNDYQRLKSVAPKLELEEKDAKG